MPALSDAERIARREVQIIAREDARRAKIDAIKVEKARKARERVVTADQRTAPYESSLPLTTDDHM